MTDFSQGDIIRIKNFRNPFLIVSNNAYIQATGTFHVCPLLEDIPAGPLHLTVKGIDGITGTVICEQLKLIDPGARSCLRRDRIPYSDLINVSDAIQGVFEYD